MGSPHRNSMVQRGGNTPAIESGQIINVDMAHWTVDVRTIHSQRLLLDLQVGAPYLHFHSGEGIYVMPEVGAKVQVCLPSDDRPFVLCFITTFERGASGDGTTQPETGDGEEAEVTFASGRPKLQQGDLMMRCRDGNQVWLHRGGVIEIESTAVAKRVYIPIGNMIRDVCENYQMLHFGGEMLWTTTRDDTDPEGEARTVFTLAAREHAQEEKSTVMVTVGHVDDETRLQIVVAPDAIDSPTREVDGDAVYDFKVDNEGNVDVTIKGDVTRHIEGTLDDTVDGEVTQEYGTTQTTINGDQTVQVSGDHELQAASSKETISGSKTIACPVTKIGGDGANTPYILATPDVIAFLAGHTHTTPAGPSGIPVTPVTDGRSRKSFGE